MDEIKNEPVAKCEHGWHDGSCCCNCSNQLELRKHPWNKEFGKGSVTESCGFVCTALQDGPDVKTGIYSDNQHGFCELHCKK